jgi:hypothetical protein
VVLSILRIKAKAPSWRRNRKPKLSVGSKRSRRDTST